MIKREYIDDYKSAMGTKIGETILVYLEARLNETKENLIISDEKNFGRLQGRASELSDLIKLARSE